MSKKYGFYTIDTETDTLRSTDDPFEYNGEMFIAKGSYGRENTLKRFKKEVLLTEDKELFPLVDVVTIEDVKPMFRVNWVPFGCELVEDDRDKVFAPCYPCWVIDCMDVLDKLPLD